MNRSDYRGVQGWPIVGPAKPGLLLQTTRDTMNKETLNEENTCMPERNTHLELKLHKLDTEVTSIAAAHRRACCELRLTQFRKGLEELISRYSIDDVTNTPDYILADHLLAQTRVLSTHTYLRDRWFGADSAIRPLLEATHHDPSLYPYSFSNSPDGSPSECPVK